MPRLHNTTTALLATVLLFSLTTSNQAGDTSVEQLPGGEARTLFDRASRELGQLTRADWELFVEVTRPVTYAATGEEPADESAPRQPLRAATLNWLCTDTEAMPLLSHRGIVIRHREILGRLDLRYARLPFPLILVDCRITDGLDLRDANIHELHLLQTEVSSLQAEGIVVEHDLLLKDGFRATESVSLMGAEIGGNLECDAASIRSESGVAFNASELVVNGDMMLRYGFETVGELDLRGARISGDLQFDEARLISTGPDALFADGMKVDGNVFLRYGFRSEGRISLIGVRVGGDFDCEFGEFENSAGAALTARRLHVGGEVRLADATFAGECNLSDARISGNLNCSSASFVEGLSLVSARIEGALVWRSMPVTENTALDLRSASVQRLVDDAESWPRDGQLRLYGFLYETIDAESPTDATRRIDWLRRQPIGAEGFRPQPYEQLASVLKQLGNFGDAEEVLIARESDSEGSLPLSERLLHRLLGLSIGYGYRPWRALWIGLSVIAFGAVVFAVGSRAGLIAATKEVEHVFEGESQHRLSDDYPQFNALVYSLDMFVPLLDLQQATYWLPSSSRGTSLINSRWYKLSAGGVLRFYLGFHIYLGWTLTTLLAVGLSGLVVQ